MINSSTKLWTMWIVLSGLLFHILNQYGYTCVYHSHSLVHIRPPWHGDCEQSQLGELQTNTVLITVSPDECPVCTITTTMAPRTVPMPLCKPGVIAYSRMDLYKFQPNFSECKSISAETCNLIKKLNIKREFRGCRGRKNSDFSKTSIVICPHKQGVHHEMINSNRPVQGPKHRSVNLANLVKVPLDSTVPTYHNFTFSVVNPRSLCNKSVDFVDHIVSSDIDLCAVAETWFKKEDSVNKNLCTPIG